MVRFVLPPWADYSFERRLGQKRLPVVVTLSIKKIEDAWKKKYLFDYVGAGGVGGKLSKYEGVKAWLSLNDTIYMPLLDLRVPHPECFRFNDGRHTYAFFRDAGQTKLEFGVPQDSEQLFVAAYGLTT